MLSKIQENLIENACKYLFIVVMAISTYYLNETRMMINDSKQRIYNLEMNHRSDVDVLKYKKADVEAVDELRGYYNQQNAALLVLENKNDNLEKRLLSIEEKLDRLIDLSLKK